MLNVQAARASLQTSTRNIPNLRAAFGDLQHAANQIRTADGWLQPLFANRGYRHVYDGRVAKGGWEFYELRRGLWLLTVDMIARCTLPRRHSFGDKLVLSAVLKGDVGINDPSGAEGELADGYCTVYGMKSGEFETTYDPGDTLRWVSVIIDRDRLVDVVNLDPNEMPDCVTNFVLNDRALPYRNIRLSGSTSLVASQILDCKFQGSSRLAFLTAKALELTCLSLFSLRDDFRNPLEGPPLTEPERMTIEHAKLLIERSLDEPPTVTALAAAVGLTRQKLQQGFRQVYGSTAGQIRDQLRIARALELVRHSQLSMIDISLETGYGHPASFTRAFKAAFGVSPMQMRRMARQDARVRRLGNLIPC